MTDGPQAATPRRIEPYYRPDDDGLVRVYSGNILVDVDGQSETLAGDLTVHLSPRPRLMARLLPSEGRLVTRAPVVKGVPSETHLIPSTSPVIAQDDFAHETQVGIVDVGDLQQVARFLIHVSGALAGRLPRVETLGGRTQARLDFEMPGWRMALVPVRSSPDDEHQFSHVLEARPAPDRAPDAESVTELLDWLFYLLSFVAGQEVGTTVVVGLDENDVPAWARWGTPRQREGRPGVRWCSPGDVATAVPALGAGLAALKSDEALARVVPRAIGFLHAASAGEVMDVRVPVACTGLELLAWARLQREGWVGREALDDLSAGATVRLLVASSGLPVEIPAHFTALSRRARAVGQPDWAGPEILFNVRNKLVHPPNRIDRIEWPTSDEMLEAWQLSTWYLELCILRALGYSGTYWSRLRLGRGEWEVEPVPWAAP